MPSKIAPMRIDSRGIFPKHRYERRQAHETPDESGVRVFSSDCFAKSYTPSGSNGGSVSPARIGTVSRFSNGGIAQLQPALYAQYGLYAMLKSTFSLPSGRALGSTYRPTAYVSSPAVVSRNGRKNLPVCVSWNTVTWDSSPSTS